MAALAVMLLGATPSQAGNLVLDFDLVGSSLTFGGLEVSDGMSGAVTGRARIQLLGVDPQGMLTGDSAQGRLSGFDLTFNLNRPIIVGVDANLVGPIRISQMGLATGEFDGTALTFPVDGFNATLTTNLGCVGASCVVISMLSQVMFPIVQNVVLNQPFSVSIQNIPGRMATLDALIMTMSGNLRTTLSIRGRQVPEPVETGLLMLGALALCSGATVRRLRAA